MKIRLLSFALICALAAPLLPSATFAAEEEHTELGDHMEKMGKAFRTLNRQLRDPAKNAESLQLVAEIRGHAEASLKLEPAKTAELPEAQRAKFVADYQAKMRDFIGHIGKLEAALKAGNNDEAVNLTRTMKEAQKEGHKEYKKADKKES